MTDATTSALLVQTIFGSAVLAAVLSAIIGGIFAYFNTRSVKELELANSRTVAEFSSKLAQAEHTFKTQFSSLHVKRGEFIESLHAKIVAVEDAFKAYANPAKREAPKDKDAWTAAFTAAVEFDKENIKSALYFGATTRAALEPFRLLLVEMISGRRLVLPAGEDGEVDNLAWIKLFQTIMEKLVPARERIEKEFRDILGVSD